MIKKDIFLTYSWRFSSFIRSNSESDWETENITSHETAENDNPLQNMAEPQTTVKPSKVLWSF